MKVIFKNTKLNFSTQKVHTYSDNKFDNATNSSEISGNLFEFTEAIRGAVILPIGALDKAKGNSNGSVSSLIPVSAGDVFVYSGTAKSNILDVIVGYKSTTLTTSTNKVMSILTAKTSELSFSNKVVKITDEMVTKGVVAIRAWGITSESPSIKKQLD